MPANNTEIEKRLWDATDELRANSRLRSSEYSIPVLGLIFLRYADEKFAHAQKELKARAERSRRLPMVTEDEEPRAVLRAELDAYYAKLYGLTEEELRYILDPADVYGEDFPGETFRVLKKKEIKRYGEYRTRRLVLEAWGRLG